MPNVVLHANDAEAFIAKYGQPVQATPRREKVELRYEELEDEARETAARANAARSAQGNPSRKILRSSTDDEGEVTLQIAGEEPTEPEEEEEEEEAHPLEAEFGQYVSGGNGGWWSVEGREAKVQGYGNALEAAAEIHSSEGEDEVLDPTDPTEGDYLDDDKEDLEEEREEEDEEA